MNTEKNLGKITKAEFGQVPDHPFLIGLQLTFESNWGGVGDGGKHTINLNKRAWEKAEGNLGDALINTFTELEATLKDAKCNFVSQLKGKPVEVTIENGMFKSFRILTEVL